ncbi:hypothetical protein CC86DRAFT_461581 [Ophiobolus disseminans]|uniref:Uncharacterized protein n=1 Tax=Ophiobolus disseminans TaxID=1469910 RepID=A0A6A7AKL5_9PLEO|nr:hypothetical protein CC86DRAFT_461581 [Ophiobolus disseminans]
MRLLLLAVLSVLLVLAEGGIIPKSLPSQGLSNVHVGAHVTTPQLESSHGLYRRAVDVPFEWNKAWCKGAKLAQALIKDEAPAGTYVTPVRSKWDGDLISAFTIWGYREMSYGKDSLCDFGPSNHQLQTAFSDLKIDTRSSGDGGPNNCYHIEHENGLTVIRDPSGELPPVTQAYTTISINPSAGAIFFLNRLSPLQAAHEYWDVPIDKITKEMLPDLSSSADHAWGFWNREKGGANLADINLIFSCMITNDITTALIAEAFRTYAFPPGKARPSGLERWSGTTFEMQYDAAQVLLGSPNGQAAGYFLAQHKHRFGKNKSIEKVTFFKADKGQTPYILFWVIDAPAGPAPGGAGAEAQSGELNKDVGEHGNMDGNATKAQQGGTEVEARIVRRSTNGKNIVREHVFRARL